MVDSNHHHRSKQQNLFILDGFKAWVWLSKKKTGLVLRKFLSPSVRLIQKQTKSCSWLLYRFKLKVYFKCLWLALLQVKEREDNHVGPFKVALLFALLPEPNIIP